MVFNYTMEGAFILFIMFVIIGSVEKTDAIRLVCWGVIFIPLVKGDTYSFFYVLVGKTIVDKVLR